MCILRSLFCGLVFPIIIITIITGNRMENDRMGHGAAQSTKKVSLELDSRGKYIMTLLSFLANGGIGLCDRLPFSPRRLFGVN